MEFRSHWRRRESPVLSYQPLSVQDTAPTAMGLGAGAEAAPHTGTTIVAVSYNGGVVIGADSRVSTGAAPP